jgi:hypothetical protein
MGLIDLARINSKSIIERTIDQVSSVLDDEVVILNTNTGKYFNLNPVGSRVWEIIETPSSIEAIVNQIMDEYSVDRDRCQSDIIQLTGKLLDADLVKVHPEQALNT